jgi:hypothetical protein
MARIFSISFLHEGRQLTAMVAMRPTPFATEYTISMLEDELMEALPGNKVLSAAPDQFAFAHQNGHTTPLMRSIMQAISEHVHTHRIVI